MSETVCVTPLPTETVVSVFAGGDRTSWSPDSCVLWPGASESPLTGGTGDAAAAAGTGEAATPEPGGASTPLMFRLLLWRPLLCGKGSRGGPRKGLCGSQQEQPPPSHFAFFIFTNKKKRKEKKENRGKPCPTWDRTRVASRISHTGIIPLESPGSLLPCHVVTRYNMVFFLPVTQIGGNFFCGEW